ncbi:recQ-mediated genome instability protein 1 [Synchiropus picturatus]
MAPEVMVHATQAWLQSSWQVQVPFAWLEACVEWLLEEAGGTGRLSQQQVNQQALDQWLLTDLRDLDFPVLPQGLAQAQKTQLRGTFCVQVDSLLDVSQPAYTQLQKWRGTECGNDEVSAVTQNTQRPWEAKPTRMLLMQVTDGVQTLEAMEYKPITALNTALRPGVKLQLSGEMTCRLGVLLLEPGNIKVLGGEVEDLADRNNQGRILCRTLGIPEEEQQHNEEEAPPSHQADGHEVDDPELDDQELLSNLEAQDQQQMVPALADSGYGTVSETSTQFSRSSSARSFISNISSRSDSIAPSHRGSLTQTNRSNSVNSQENCNLMDHPSSVHMNDLDNVDQHMEDEDFPEDFDNLPLDEWENTEEHINEDLASMRSSSNVTGRVNNSSRSPKPQSGHSEHMGSSRIRPSLGMTSQSSHQAGMIDEFMEEDMDCFPVDVNPAEVKTDLNQGKPKPSTSAGDASSSEVNIPSKSAQHPPSEMEAREVTAPLGVTLTSAPFTYLSLVEKQMAKPDCQNLEVCVKAFIVTLLGKLSSSDGLWRVSVTISDGTGYLDVELSDEVLRGMLGFSVAERSLFKHDATRRSQLAAGMKRCQEELVDMCCLMTVSINADRKNGVVTKVQPVSEKIQQQLEQRVRNK